MYVPVKTDYIDLKAYESHCSLSKDPLDVPGEENLQTKENLKFIENISAEEQS